MYKTLWYFYSLFRVPIYWELRHGGSSNLCPWRHFVSKLDTSLYSKSMGNSCQLSHYRLLLENEAIKPIKSIHFWEANIITIPKSDMSTSIYRVGKKHIGCNIKNMGFSRFLVSRHSLFTCLVHYQLYNSYLVINWTLHARDNQMQAQLTSIYRVCNKYIGWNRQKRHFPAIFCV